MSSRRNLIQKSILIKNGKLVNWDKVSEEDVYIENGIIKSIGKDINVQQCEKIIDAKGMYVLPGGIDPHTHFEMQFMGTTTIDDFYTGTKAAVAGGTTMIIDFVFPQKGESMLQKYHEYRKKADSKVCCDYALHMVVHEWNDKSAKEMKILCEEYGINSFKSFMAYSHMLNDSELYSVFDNCKRLGAVPLVHAENGQIINKNSEKLLANGIKGPEGHELSRPECVEAEACNRACMIANQVGSPLYVVHVMSRPATEELVRARKMYDIPIVGETLAAGLACDGSATKHTCFQHAAGHLLSPPLRSDPTTPSYLMQALARDDLQLTGSDNCTFNKQQKELGLNNFTQIPNGVNGVEDRMSVIWEKGVNSGILDLQRFVSITSTNAAKMFNLFPQKGCIAVGSDADIVVWNPNKRRVISKNTHHQAVDFNIFEGMTINGVPDYVIVNGNVCVDNGNLNITKGFGRYMECPLYPEYFYPKN